MNKTISGIIDNHNAYIDLRKQKGEQKKCIDSQVWKKNHYKIKSS